MATASMTATKAINSRSYRSADNFDPFHLGLLVLGTLALIMIASLAGYSISTPAQFLQIVGLVTVTSAVALGRFLEPDRIVIRPSTDIQEAIYRSAKAERRFVMKIITQVAFGLMPVIIGTAVTFNP